MKKQEKVVFSLAWNKKQRKHKKCQIKVQNEINEDGKRDKDEITFSYEAKASSLGNFVQNGHNQIWR